MGVASSWKPNSQQQDSMQYFVLATAVLAMASGLTIKTKEIEHGFCPGSPEPIKLESISINPYPIKVVSNGEINLDVLVSLFEEVPADSKIQLKIVKKGTIIDLPRASPSTTCTSDHAHTMRRTCSTDLRTSCAPTTSPMARTATCR